jgi:hypothetical protein
LDRVVNVLVVDGNDVDPIARVHTVVGVAFTVYFVFGDSPVSDLLSVHGLPERMVVPKDLVYPVPVTKSVIVISSENVVELRYTTLAVLVVMLENVIDDILACCSYST